MKKQENYILPSIEQNCIEPGQFMCQSAQFDEKYGTEWLKRDEDYEL